LTNSRLTRRLLPPYDVLGKSWR